MKDLDSLSANYGNGGAGGGNAGHAGAGHTGGSSASGGDTSAGEGGVAGEGEGGEAGSTEPSTGGTAGHGGGTPSGGRGGSGGTCESQGLTTCDGVKECVDLSVGTPKDNGVDNCGMCGTSCNLTSASSATCAAATCVLVCNGGLGDCNASTDNDGCEADLALPAHCGSCENACSLVGATGADCSSGKCTPTCAPLYADCNGSDTTPPNDGCEVFFDALDHCTTGCTAVSVTCDPLQVCNAGTCGAASGLTVFSTPLTSSGQAQRYADIFLPTPNSPGIDLTGFTVTMRVYAPGATAGSLVMYMSDVPSGLGPETAVDLTTFSQKWVDLSIPIVAGGAFNPKVTKQINMDIRSGNTNGPWQSPATLVYVDSVRVSNGSFNDTFDLNVGAFVKSGLVKLEGSMLSWTQAVP